MKKILVLVLSLAGASFAFGHCGSCEGDQAAAAERTHAACELKCDDGCCELIRGYERISAALAADDLEAAKAAAKDIECFAECEKDDALGTALGTIANAKSLADARDGFKTVSASVIARSKDAGAHYVMTCPMADADWLQTSKDVANPYMGKAMLKCGAIKQTVAARQ